MRFRIEHLALLLFFLRRGQGSRKIMRRRSRHQLVRTVALTIVGAIFGFSVTMCVQTLKASPVSELHNACVEIQTTSQDLDQSSSAGSPRRDDDDQRVGSPKNSFFVGVMTAQKFVDTRAYGIFSTWAQNLHANGSVAFFVSQSTQSSRDDVQIPLVRLPGVDDSYPPQKKSFSMLKYFHDHLLDQYEWFVRVDDDAYLRLDKLEVLLRSLNSSQPLFIGQAGLGTPEEYGQLNLGVDENYCMGGPGIVLSHETLRRIGPHIGECLGSLATTHEDVELGRCVKRFAGVTCTWSYEMQTLFHNNQSGLLAYTGDLNVPEVHHSITLHPLKQLPTLYRLHNFMRGLKLSDLRFRSLQLSRDVLASIRELQVVSIVPNEELAKVVDYAAPPSLMKFIPGKHEDLLTWEFLSPTIAFCFGAPNCPRHNIESYWRSATTSVIRQVMDSVNKYARQRGRMLDFQGILYGYRRVDPLHGVDYVFDMLLLYKKFKGQRVTVPVRRHAYLQQSFGRLQLIEDEASQRYDQRPIDSIDLSTQAQSKKVVHIILPLAGRSSTFLRFIDLFERTCLKTGEAVNLFVVLFCQSSNSSVADDAAIRESIRGLQQTYGQSIRLFELTGDFSRGAALSFGASKCPPDALMFFTDVDVALTSDFLRRVRLNAIRGRRVYFPVVFSQYALSKSKDVGTDSDSGRLVYDSENGYFRHFGYGLVGLYREDFDAVGGFDLKIRGWGLEDVELFDKFMKRTNLTILRVPEPDLVHVHHPISCDSRLSPGQYEMCLGSKAASFASVHALSDAFYNSAQFLSFGAKHDKMSTQSMLKDFL